MGKVHTPKGTPGPRHNLHDTQSPYEEQPFGVVLEHDQDEEEFSNVARQHCEEVFGPVNSE